MLVFLIELIYFILGAAKGDLGQLSKHAKQV